MNKLSEEQILKMIELIRERPGIYDTQLLTYKNREWKEKCWFDIGTIIDADEKYCKVAWRSLKDQFVRKIRELRNKPENAEGEMRRKHKYFDRLIFLKEIIEPRIKNNNANKNEAGLNISENDLTQSTFYDDATNQTNEDHAAATNSRTHFEYSASNSNSSSLLMEINSMQTKTEPNFDFVPCASTNTHILVAPAPDEEASPKERSKRRDPCAEDDCSNTGKRLKADKVKDTFAGFLDKLTKTIEADPEPEDNMDVFFKSMAKSAKTFKLTTVEQTTFMVGVTQLLHKILADRGE